MASEGSRQCQFTTPGVTVVKLNGIFMHYTSSISPSSVDDPRYAELYVLDPREAVMRRGALFGDHCDSAVITSIESALRESNVYVRSFVPLRDVASAALDRGETVDDIRMLVSADATRDARRYNCPVTNDVGVVFRSHDGAMSFGQDIVVHCRSGGKIRISDIHPLCDPLSFPLIYSTRVSGWKMDTAQK